MGCDKARLYRPADAIQVPGIAPYSVGVSAEVRGSTSKRGAKEFGGGHSGTIFSSLSAEDADTQAVVFKIPEAVCSSLDELHFSVEAFGNPVVLREAEHPGNLFLP